MLQAIARRRPLLVLLDDLQWADLGSISLFFHLARAIEGSPILLAAAYRPAELALGCPPGLTRARNGTPAAERHPLTAVINELKRRWGDVELALDAAEDQGFIDDLLDSEPNRLGAAFRRTLFRQTHGHPLFTVELLRGMRSAAT